MSTVSRPTTVEMTLAVELVESSWGEEGSYSIACAYRTDMPLSVFMRGASGVLEFGRDLLREGLERTMTGAGDVKLINHGLTVLVNINVPDGYATYAFDRGDLRAFLRATQRVCEFGTEQLAIPDDVSALLEDGAR